MFELKDVTYRDILDISSLHIPDKRITCLVGESGAGKSTLLKMLNMMISPDKGNIYYRNENIENLDPIQHRRRVVMLAQQPTIFEGTIRDNLNIGLVYSGETEKIDYELSEALELVSLHKKLDEVAHTLSGGEKQRLALARIYLMDPEVYLLDEPTSALDEDTEDAVMKEFITGLKNRGKTAVLISHSQKLVSTYGDHNIKMSKAKVNIDG